MIAEIKNNLRIILVLSCVHWFIPNLCYGQYSSVYIQEKINLVDSNCVFFTSNDIDSICCSKVLKLINGNGLILSDSVFHTYEEVSGFLNNFNQKRNQNFDDLLKHRKPKILANEYVFQIIALRNANNSLNYFIIVLMKSYYPDWKNKPIFRYDGAHTYQRWGVIN